jgi:hypothetical protein
MIIRDFRPVIERELARARRQLGRGSLATFAGIYLAHHLRSPA